MQRESVRGWRSSCSPRGQRLLHGEDSGHRRTEAGQQLAAGQYIGRGEHDRFAIGSVDRHGLRLWIDHPNGRASGVEPGLHLGEHFARPIVGREHLDRQVGAPGKNPLGSPSPTRSTRTNATSGASTVSGLLETRNPVSAPKTTPRARGFTKSLKIPAISADNHAMFRSGGRHHDEFSAQQFTPAKVGGLEELFGSRNGLCGDHAMVIYRMAAGESRRRTERI